jgi:hypothetical protein
MRGHLGRLGHLGNVGHLGNLTLESGISHCQSEESHCQSGIHGHLIEANNDNELGTDGQDGQLCAHARVYSGAHGQEYVRAGDSRERILKYARDV